MQELFVDKIHLFRFLSIIDKPWLDQLKVITATRVVVIQEEEEIPTRKVKYPVLETNTKHQQLIKHTKISYSIASLVFFKFLYVTYRNGLNRNTQIKPRHSKSSASKSMSPVSLIPFLWNLDFSVLEHSVRYLQNLFVPWR